MSTSAVNTGKSDHSMSIFLGPTVLHYSAFVVSLTCTDISLFNVEPTVAYSTVMVSVF